jgi:hypothetical protein
MNPEAPIPVNLIGSLKFRVKNRLTFIRLDYLFVGHGKKVGK